ncbi:MAG: phospholipid carrier-dependent glycosyltransferase [Candidatus Woesearchaeota archaeon]
MKSFKKVILWILSNKQISAILCIAFLIYFIGSWWGLPYLYHPDEQDIIDIALGFFSGDLNPHFFIQPTFPMYLIFTLLVPVSLIIFIMSKFRGNQAGGLYELLLQEKYVFYFVGRLVNILFSVGCVLLVYLITKRLTKNRDLSTLTAVIFSVLPVIVENSKYALNSMPLAFWVLVSFYFCLGISQSNDIRNYILAGFFAGLAASTKYFGLLVILPVVSAHLLKKSSKRQRLVSRKLVLACLGFLGSFIMTSPFIFLDQTAIGSILVHFNHIKAEGHLGYDAMPAAYAYLQYLLKDFGLILFFACATAVVFLLFKRIGLVLLSYPLVFLLYISTWKVYYPRYLISVVPFLIISLAFMLNDISGSRIIGLLRKNTKLYYLGTMILLIALLYHPVARAVLIESDFLKQDTRTIAKIWIENNISPGSKIAYEFYCPQLDVVQKGNFTLFKEWQIVSKPLEFYVNESVDYIILSSTFKYRFLNETKRYNVEVERYSQIEANSELVYEITANQSIVGPKIWVYRLK